MPDRTEPLYDFPCSFTFRAYEALINEGMELPPLEPLSPIGETRSESETYTPEPEWTAKQWDIVNQLRAQALFFEKKLNEHLDKKKKDVL